MDRVDSGGTRNLQGYTYLFGPVYTGDVMSVKYLGELRPVAHVNLGLTMLNDALDYPIQRFKPALGIEFAVGAQRRNLDLRLGYRYYQLDRDQTLDSVDTSDTSDSLNLSGVFMEVGYRFNFLGR